MPETAQLTSVNIRPDVGVLSVLQHLNYRPWFALAEFVDNSLESFLTHRDLLDSTEGGTSVLRVEIAIDSADSGTIAIRDNAAGIYAADYQRAFRPAEPPPPGAGLSEFGIGMKSAACWFATRFTVRSSALGEAVERTVVFDIDSIVAAKSETLPIQATQAEPEQHFTEVLLTELHRAPQGRTIGKIKDHLASIYREFIRSGVLELRFRSLGQDDILRYEEPEILEAAPDGKVIRKHNLTPDSRLWRKDIEFDFGTGLKVRGFAALRRKGSTSKAGFALFRRNRVIEGSSEDSYRPAQIFGATTTATYQRLFGELHLEGFSVSHTKDGFKWDENEEPFLDLLRDHLNAEPLPLLDQARDASYDSIREKDEPVENVDTVVTEAVRDTTEVLRERVAPLLEQQMASTPLVSPLPPELPRVGRNWKEVLEVSLNGVTWRINVEVTDDPSVGDWVTVFDTGPVATGSARELGVRLSIAHPFMTRFVGPDVARVAPFVRLSAAIGLAEITAREAGVRQAGEMRRNMNQLLRDALSRS